MKTWSELNPKASLRNWYFNSDKSTAIGYFWNSNACEDNTPGHIINIKTITDYKDHKIVVTLSGEYFLLEKKYMRLNGG